MRSSIVSVLAAVTSASVIATPSVASADTYTRIVCGSAGYQFFDAVAAFLPLSKYVTTTDDVGSEFVPSGAAATVVDYPWFFFEPGVLDRNITVGAENLYAAVQATEGTIVVAGTSHGAANVGRLQMLLESDPNAPSPDRLSLFRFNDPTFGATPVLFPDNFRIPFLGYVVSPSVESRYDTTIVAHEYDMWGDFPDRPWNLLALINSLAGAVFVHQLAAGVPEGLAPQSVTVNSLGATATSYLVPTDNLPITEPLRIIGVPDSNVDRIDAALRPVIDAGYSRHDEPEDTRPYLSHGQLTTSTQTTPAAAAGADVSDAVEYEALDEAPTVEVMDARPAAAPKVTGVRNSVPDDSPRSSGRDFRRGLRGAN